MPNFHLVKIDELEPVQVFSREEMEKTFGMHYTVVRCSVPDGIKDFMPDEDECALVVREYPGKSLTESHFSFPLRSTAEEALTDAKAHEGEFMGRQRVRHVTPLKKRAQEFEVYGYHLPKGTKIWTAGRGKDGYGPFTIQETHVEHIGFIGYSGGTYHFTNLTPDGQSFIFNKDGYQLGSPFTNSDLDLDKLSVDPSHARAFTRLEDVVAYAKVIAPKLKKDFLEAERALTVAQDTAERTRDTYEGVQKYAEQADRVLGAVPAP